MIRLVIVLAACALLLSAYAVHRTMQAEKAAKPRVQFLAASMR
jgi:hypothetical protein